MQFDAVVANPPYMGGKYLVKELKDFVNVTFPNAKGDLFACFIERGYTLANDAGYSAMITMQSWMFLSSFEQMRERLVWEKTIENMSHLGNGVMIGFGTTAFVLKNISVPNFFGTYSYISTTDIGAEKIPLEFPVKNGRFSIVSQDKFRRIPGTPIGYWVGKATIDAFDEGEPIGDALTFKQGMATSNNERFLRQWYEVSQLGVDATCNTPENLRSSVKKWFPYSKGGTYRKWYGNNELLVNWEHDGREMKSFTSTLPQGMNVRLKSREYYCLPSLTYSTLALTFGCRMNDSGFIFDVKGSCIFGADMDRAIFCGFLNTNVARHFLEILCPTLDFQMVGIRQLPVLLEKIPNCSTEVMSARHLSMDDWDSYERSWNFHSFPLLRSTNSSNRTLESNYNTWITMNREIVARLQEVETEINRLFINAYCLNGEINPEVPIEEITLTVNPAYRYGGNLSLEDKWIRFRVETCEEMISYAIGCMMGRYSLDEPGLIYAHAGNVGFEPGRYATFPADADGIVPTTDELWFADDAPSRIREFLRAVWGPDTLEENMAWLAESLGTKASETPDETIRRYIADKFFKDHLQTYKKRPIYWLFSSGKQGAFQALVYLHRYHEGTLARLRAEYVVPLTGKIQSRIEMLQKDAAAASSTAARNKLAKEVEKLKKKHVELLAYDEQLRHYADMRITLDLDDGVKVNYGKFGDLLEGVKVVTGGAGDD